MSSSLSANSTLIALLQHRTTHTPNQTAYTFLSDGELDAKTITYQGLDQQARIIATRLRQENVIGERAILLYPPGLDYIAAFFGCLYAGIVAVPAYPPRLNRPTSRLEAIVANSSATTVLALTQTLSDMQRRLDNFPYLEPLHWIATDQLDTSLADTWYEPSVTGEALAFLQYTSGSTSTPKGVMLTHNNLLSNLGHIKRSFALQEDNSVGVIWLPPYHDMGLIGGILEPMYSKFPVVLMPPVAFLQRPIRWLEAISRYGGTVSGGPNFAYEACMNNTTPEQRHGLDLSTWKVAFTGAEPVRPETLARFAETFAPYGFRSTAFYPCYGLAEATLIVSGGVAGAEPHIITIDEKGLEQNRAVPTVRDDPAARALTSCGYTMQAQRLVIANLETQLPCADNEVGEIWVAGPSIAQGYWARPAETAHAFQAHLANDTTKTGFLRTGDLGFMQGDELYVTGRLKDLIIIRGRNYYPQDIELTVEGSYPSLIPGAGAAFTVKVGDEDRLVVAQEISHRHRDPNIEEIAGVIRQAVAEEHELNLYGVVLLRNGSIPKTSSGKIMRHACRNGFLDGSLQVVGQSILGEDPAAFVPTDRLPPTPVPEASFILKTLLAVNDSTLRSTLLMFYLQEQIARILRVSSTRIIPTQSLNSLGLDSLMLFELKNEVEGSLGIVVPLDLLLDGPSIQVLATALVPLLNQPTEIAPPIAVPTGRYPLSYGQRSLWFLQQLAPESTAYIIATAVRIEAPLKPDILRRAFQYLVARHPVLRTVFTVVNNEVQQEIFAEGTLFFQETDGATWSDADVQIWLDHVVQYPFDLEQGPLLRLYLLRRTPQSWVLLLTVHHSIMDLWSLVVLLDDLRTSYEALRQGRPIDLPPLSHSYIDYQQWQSDFVTGAEGEKLWGYWSQQLAGPLPVLNLPTDRPRPPFQSFEGATAAFTIPPAVVRGLQTLTRENNTTLYTVLLAAFQIFLGRYTGQEDILVGSPTAGRNRSQWVNILGYFVNPLVLRATLRGNPTFTVFLQQVRQTVLDALAHQDYPFPLLVERLQPERDPSYSPLFQAMFVLQKPHRMTEEGLPAFILNQGAQMQLGDLTLHPHPLMRHIAQFDLSLLAVETGDTIQATFEYNTDLFRDDTIARMVANFQQLLASIVAMPHQQISDLPLLAKPELSRLLVEWNRTALSYPTEARLSSLVETQVARTPNAPAVVVGQTVLSYADLNTQANQLARYLQEQGIGVETCVGICLDRSPALIVAILAVLKAGGTYVPLDPSYPADRLAFLLDDTQAPVILTQRNLHAHLPPSAATLLFLDDDPAPWHDYPATNPVQRALPDNVAYLIYTSGSTGRPKGVAIMHRNAVAMVAWAKQVYPLEQLTGVLASTSINFDLSVFEIFVPLSAGGAVIVVDNALGLIDLDAALPVTLINTVPSAIIELLHLNSIPASVRRINLAGEPLRTEVVNALYNDTAVEDVFDLYGPSEDTTYSTYARRVANAPATIGRPIANSQVYLLDRHMKPVPQGVPGELYLGGDGVARGYLRRPDLTAERFVPNPFGAEPGARLYKTGDLARYFSDGNLEFLGRLDYQVKIRGFRIELSEIETVLRQYPSVAGAVVMAQGKSGDLHLVAYLVPQDAERLDVSAVRQFLKQHVPEYMIPPTMLVLEAFPLTQNGKIDRNALPTPETVPTEINRGVLPRTEIESRLVALWADVLGGTQVGIHQNFFDAGGHSLLAMRLIARIRDTLSVELPVRAFFAAPTVAELAAHIAERTAASDRPVLVPSLALKRHTYGETTPLSFAQQRLWLLEQLEPGNATYNMPAAVRLQGRLNVAALARSLTEIVARHEVLRTTFTVNANQPVQHIAPPHPFTLVLDNRRNVPSSGRDAEIQQLIRTEARQPFYLTTGPLFRGKLVQFDDHDYVLLLTLHHIVADGWSLGILIDELMTLYPTYRHADGTVVASPLPELPIQYADYTLWQREKSDVGQDSAALKYWTTQLEDLPTLELLTDYARPPLMSDHGAHVPLRLSRALSDALHGVSQQAKVTLFMTLLTAFQVLLARYTNQTDIVVGSPISGRTHQEMEKLIGMFVNTLVLRTDLSGNPTFRDAVVRVRDMVLQAFAHQTTPFEQLVTTIQPERDLSRHPLFQVMFAMNEPVAETLALPDLTVEVLDADQDTAKFDLTLTLTDSQAGIVGSFEYNVDLFAPDTVVRMAEHFVTLLEAIVTDPHRSILSLPLVPDTEYLVQLESWNATAHPYPADACLPDVWEAVVAEAPQAVALIGETSAFSYEALNSRANQLAHLLQQHGVGAEIPVAVCLPRSPDSIVAFCAILKAGGVYVPMDPDAPTERLAWMLADTEARVLITHTSLSDHLPTHQAVTLLLDTSADLLATQPVTNPTRDIRPDHLAYMIYTSGSTGVPKGVGISHRAIVCHTAGISDYYQVQSNDRLLAFASFTFDASFDHMLPAFLNGATVVLREQDLWTPKQLEAKLTETGVTIADFSTSYYHVLAQEWDDATSPPPLPLRLAVVGGETLLPSTVDLWQGSRLRHSALLNTYGPTEATVSATVYTVAPIPGDQQRIQRIPIGRPLPNYTAYILDREGRLVPPGLPGELYLGGIPLARGYHRQPALTAERFVPNPFSTEMGARLYKTGDLARFRADGEIEFLGRRDDQVKIRGFRVELGEVESTLLQHQDVREAVVLVHAPTPATTSQQLVAYVVTRPDVAIDANDLRAYINTRLPTYMVPSAIMLLEALPVRSSGKIDRKALPAPTTVDALAIVAPRSETEETLARLWVDLLQLEQVSVEGNFFDQGGHSLLATQLLSRVAETFNVDIPLRTFFEAPTIAGLAVSIAQRQALDVDAEFLRHLLETLEEE